MKISDLMGCRLVTESGEHIGHVFDVRVKRDPRSSGDRADQRWKLDSLLFGGRGVLSRFGAVHARERVARSRHDELPWSDVVAVAPGEITVRDRRS
jgi:hypothetical protein